MLNFGNYFIYSALDIIKFGTKDIGSNTNHILIIQIDFTIFVKSQVLLDLFRQCDVLFWLLFANRIKLLNNIEDFLRCREHVIDVLEKEVAHESTANHFDGLNLSRNRENFFGVEFDEFAIFVFSDNREEIE